MRSMRRTTIAAAAVTTAMLALTACGSDSDDSSAASTPAMSSPSMSTAMAMANEPFGAGCAAVPETGDGSFVGMSSDTVATAASNNPALSTLVSAVTAADLGSTLDSAEAVTVFAPANAAFEAVPKKDLDALLADKAMLTKVLTYHVVPGQLTPADLAGTHKTLEGSTLTVAGGDEDFTVNDSAAVVCGNVKTANATVYIIDGVLMPTS
jgi:uncharacterized surface protein with fasciclin (FAS1) repeats